MDINLDEYNPYPSFQDGQKEAITQVLEHYENGEKVVTLNAPTAAGKSLDLYVLGRIFAEVYNAPRVLYTTPLVALANQLEKTASFNEMPVLTGKKNYPCGYIWDILTSEMGIEERYIDPKAYTADECPFPKWDHACAASEICGFCPYHISKERFMNSPFGATTLARYMIGGPVRQSTTFLLVDESASLEEKLIAESAFQIPETVDLNNLQEELVKLHFMYSTASDEAYKSAMAIKQRNMIQEKVKFLKESKRFERKAAKVSKVIGHLINERDYIINKDRVFKLLNGTPIFKHLIEGLELCVLASGTPTTEIIYKDHAQVIIQHPINVDRRMCYYQPIGQMNFANREKTAPKIAEKIAEMHATHGKKTMVHCGTYGIQDMLYNALPADAKKVSLLHDTESREDMKNEFLESEGTIFLSVAFFEGLDLKGQDYPLNIIAKVPFENIKDEYIAARNNSDGWVRYNQNAAVNVMQAAGRCTRSPTDYSETYIFDASWAGFYARNKKLFHPWFTASLKNAMNRPYTGKLTL